MVGRMPTHHGTGHGREAIHHPGMYPGIHPWVYHHPYLPPGTLSPPSAVLGERALGSEKEIYPG